VQARRQTFKVLKILKLFYWSPDKISCERKLMEEETYMGKWISMVEDIFYFFSIFYYKQTLALS
jgi:hypothetical protein